MDSSSTETQNGNGNGCGSGPAPQPCACCSALAQLRMPWLDVAVQHAAPHYPQNPNQPFAHPYSNAYPPQTSPYHTAQSFQQQPVYEEDEPKTTFFKLPFLSAKTSKKRKDKRTRRVSRKESGEVVNLETLGVQGGDSIREGHESPCDLPSEDADSPDDASCSEGPDDPESDSESAKKKTKKLRKFNVKFGLQGLAVGLLGIMSPAFLLAATMLSTPKRITLVTLHHPVETILEFLLVIAIPIVNYLVWSAICKNRFNLSRWLIMALGSCVGTGVLVAGICFAGLFGSHEDLVDAIGSDFTMGFAWLGALSFLAGSSSAYLVHRLRQYWELPSARLNVTVQAATGLILAILAFAGAEYRPWCIRMAQYNAVSKDEVTRKEGLKWLRQLNPEREMRMECSDSRAAGLAGLFFPIKSVPQQQLYFTLTGTPYSFRDEKATDLASMSDAYLSRHVVGDRIPNLELARSSLNGVMHANTLTSTLNWTFVVRNGTSSAQEMRAEIALPVGAAVTGLKVWRRGEAADASIVSSGKSLNTVSSNSVDGSTEDGNSSSNSSDDSSGEDGNSSSNSSDDSSGEDGNSGESSSNSVQIQQGTQAQYVTAGSDVPGMVTDLGHGRVLVHCYPVPHDEELKVMVTMVVPLKSENSGEASLMTPQLLASNFGLEGEHNLRLRSTSRLISSVNGLEMSTNPSGESIISGVLSNQQMETSPLLITAKRDQASRPFAVLDKIATFHHTQELKQKEKIRVQKAIAAEKARVAAINARDAEEVGQVVLMIDGSKGVDFNKIVKKQKHVEKAKVIKPKAIPVEPQYVVEDIKKMGAPAPKHLVIVLDGSSGMNEHRQEIADALTTLPKSIPTSLIVASQESDKHINIQDLQNAMPNLSSKVGFVGGQDNLQAVVRAAELASETKDSAVLWIHGPQPTLNGETYIINSYSSPPAFYELPVVAGTDTFEFFRNHAEIGPFTQVPRNGKSVQNDLETFFTRWNPNNNSLAATLSETAKVPSDAVAPSREEAREMLTLRAVEECNKLISTRYFRRATRLALEYGFVSSVSCAILDNNTSKIEDADNVKKGDENDEAAPKSTTISAETKKTADSFDVAGQVGSVAMAPILQGATNGTVGPQGSDATVIMGVNTAGTVRVNNLANLEALLNIIANLGELGAVIAGIGLMAHGFMNKDVVRIGEDIELGSAGRLCLGAFLIACGLALPGMLNWFVASARDANLFS